MDHKKKMHKYVFVFDLDETLVYVDKEKVLVRPYSESVLHFLWNEPRAVTVLWSAADESYVYNVLNVLHWHHYFTEVFCRKNCEISCQLFGSYKSRKYLERCLSKYLTLPNLLKYILVDDRAVSNTSCDDDDDDDDIVGYDFAIEIPPFHGENGDMNLYKCLKRFDIFKWTPSHKSNMLAAVAQ